MSKPDREAMLDRDCIDLSMRRQCTLLRLARSGVYRRKAAPDPDDLAVMKRIDELYLAMPFYGSRKMVEALRAEGRLVNRKRVRRLMRLMGLVALAPKPGTSKASPQNKIYPYLLRGLTIEQPNHVWAADITYIPMAKGFLYLVAIIDWASRAVLAWRLSNTMDTAFCLEALHEALVRFGKPEIFNTDQGAQVHQHGLHGPAPDRRHPHLNGRARSLDGQRFHRAGLALAQIRGGTSQSIYGRP
jgi:putative transposase